MVLTHHPCLVLTLCCTFESLKSQYKSTYLLLHLDSLNKKSNEHAAQILLTQMESLNLK